MPVYNYLAKNVQGEKVKGKVEASNEANAAKTLNKRNLLVIKVAPEGAESFISLKNLIKGVKYGDLVTFTRQLATMINAGLPLATALSILEESSNEEMAKLVGDILKEVEDGNTFSAALQKNSRHFSRVYIHLVRAGEIGGVLDNVLNKLADTMEKEKEFRAKTKGAMIYPVIVLIAMVVVGFIMMIFVIPKLMSMYDEFGAELPLPTKILMGASNMMAKFWYIFIGGTMAGIYGLRAWSKTDQGDQKIDEFLFKIPIFGDLRKKIILTDFARTLSLLLGAGVSLLEALEIVTDAMDSVSYRMALGKATKRVEKGSPLSESMAGQNIFPRILHQMMAVGEETGRIDEVLLKLSIYFESESEQAVKNLTAAMEPLIMVILAIGVGFMVIAIILPIYNLTSQF